MRQDSGICGVRQRGAHRVGRLWHPVAVADRRGTAETLAATLVAVDVNVKNSLHSWRTLSAAVTGADSMRWTVQSGELTRISRRPNFFLPCVK